MGRKTGPEQLDGLDLNVRRPIKRPTLLDAPKRPRPSWWACCRLCQLLAWPQHGGRTTD